MNPQAPANCAITGHVLLVASDVLHRDDPPISQDLNVKIYVFVEYVSVWIFFRNCQVANWVAISEYF